MSLTSYRAAPPRDKPLRASPKTETDLANAEAPIPSGDFLRRQPGPKPLGASGMYQRRCALERGRERSFREFMTAKTRYFPRQIPGKTALARSSTKAQAWGQETQGKCHGSPWRRANVPMPRFRGPVLTHHPGMTVDGLLRRFAPRNDDGRNNNRGIRMTDTFDFVVVGGGS